MKKIFFIISMAVLYFSLSAFISRAPTNQPDNFSKLVYQSWKLKEIEVAGYSYTDSITTDLHLKFYNDGYCSVNHDNINLIPWVFQDIKTQTVIRMNPNTAEEQVWKIGYLSPTILIYHVDYTVKGTTYNYIYKFINVESNEG